MSDEKEELKRLKEALPFHRIGFEMAVEATCLEVTDIAKQISSAIGEISIDEAYDAIINEFIRRLKS